MSCSIMKNLFIDCLGWGLILYMQRRTVWGMALFYRQRRQLATLGRGWVEAARNGRFGGPPIETDTESAKKRASL